MTQTRPYDPPDAVYADVHQFMERMVETHDDGEERQRQCRLCAGVDAHHANCPMPAVIAWLDAPNQEMQ